MKRNALIWEIHHADTYAIVGGTMHLAMHGTEGVRNRLLRIFDRNPAAFYTETELDQFPMTEIIQAQHQYPGLRSQVTPIRYRKMRQHLRKRTDLDLDTIQHLPPLMVQTLISSALAPTYTLGGIDQILWDTARSRDIPTHGLESVAEQLEIYGRIPSKYQYHQLKGTLKNLTQTTRMIKKMAKLYRDEAIHKLYQVSKKSLGPIRHLMIRERNTRMVDRIIGHMEATKGTLYLTFGAAHLSGEHGILHQFNHRGCRIKAI